VVARFSDYAWWGNNIAKELPVVLEVGTSKTAERDMWSPPGGGMMEVTVGPILGSRPVPGTTFAEQLFLGSVILGYKMDDEEANRLRDLTKAEVCFFYAGKVSAGTLGVEQLKALQAQVIEQEDVRLRGRVSPDSIFDLAGRRYRAVAGLFSSQANSRTTAGFVLLLSSDDYLKPITVLNTYIPLAGAAIFLVMLVFTATIGRGFIRPFEVLDQGIHEIINGNQEYVFPTSRRESLAGNMGHSLNMLVCTLLGKPVPEDDDSPGPGLRPGAAEWKDPLFIDEAAQVRKRPEMVGLAGLGGGARKARGTDPSKSDNSGSNNLGDSTLAVSEVPVARVEPGRDTQELLVEAEDKYFKRLYDEYLAARSETGEGVKGVTLEKFMEKLRSSEQQIRDQLGCRMVRFRVQKKDGKTTLKPIPIE